MRKGTALIMSLLLLVMLCAGCAQTENTDAAKGDGGEKKEEQDEITIGVSFMTLNSPFLKRCKEV